MELENYIQSQVQTHGKTLAQRVRLFLTLFAQRPDIHVYGYWNTSRKITQPTKKSFGKAVNSRSLNSFIQKEVFPLELIAFMSEIGSLRFEWDFADKTSGMTQLPRGSNGGMFKFDGLKASSWYPRPDYDEDFDYVEYAMFDNYVAEGTTQYSYSSDNNRKDAELWFANANDCERHYMGSLEMYMTQGIKRAFTWYWQMDDWEGKHLYDELVQKSIPSTTPKTELLALLEEKGCESEDAKAMYNWLGQNIHILFPKS